MIFPINKCWREMEGTGWCCCCCSRRNKGGRKTATSHFFVPCSSLLFSLPFFCLVFIFFSTARLGSDSLTSHDLHFRKLIPASRHAYPPPLTAHLFHHTCFTTHSSPQHLLPFNVVCRSPEKVGKRLYFSGVTAHRITPFLSSFLTLPSPTLSFVCFSLFSFWCNPSLVLFVSLILHFLLV